ncbi:hypothetical protein ANN_19541 [Periplaneta americana]|uniref:Uncharacterized protein n=1 Tax=Periplaneta americana TaxID=6978 RepID=A0ABQ8SA76_PERAM|nr:hypothetical protein ANN_19541 [Periplaneta americana]
MQIHLLVGGYVQIVLLVLQDIARLSNINVSSLFARFEKYSQTKLLVIQAFLSPLIPPFSSSSPSIPQIVMDLYLDGIEIAMFANRYEFAYENMLQIIELFRITFQHNVRCIYTTHATRALQGRDLSGEDRRRRFSFDNLRDYIVVYCNTSNSINDDKLDLFRGVMIQVLISSIRRYLRVYGGI